MCCRQQLTFAEGAADALQMKSAQIVLGEKHVKFTLHLISGRLSGNVHACNC
jgi:hypothetical protein